MKKLMTALAASLCLSMSAQVAIYKYTERGTVTGDFQAFRVLYSGYVILDLQSGELSGVQTLTSTKQYMDLDLSTLLLSQIHSKTAQYSLFHDAYSGTNTAGDPIVIFSWFKGANARVDIGDVSTWQIPRTMQMTERWVYWQDGEQQSEEDVGTLTLDLKDSVTSNKEGDDATAAADRIKAFLESKGYTEAPS